MFRYDEENNIYHQLGTSDEFCACGCSTKDMSWVLVMNDSHLGHECEECKKMPYTKERDAYGTSVMETF